MTAIIQFLQQLIGTYNPNMQTTPIIDPDTGTIIDTISTPLEGIASLNLEYIVAAIILLIVIKYTFIAFLTILKGILREV